MITTTITLGLAVVAAALLWSGNLRLRRRLREVSEERNEAVDEMLVLVARLRDEQASRSFSAYVEESDNGLDSCFIVFRKGHKEAFEVKRYYFTDADRDYVRTFADELADALNEKP